MLRRFSRSIVGSDKKSTTLLLQQQLAQVRMPSHRFSTMPLVKKINITHLQQAHATMAKEPTLAKTRELHPQLFSQVVRCQFQLAKFLSKQKDPLVVSEGVTNDLTQPVFKTSFTHREKYALLCSVFPQGLPNDFTQLNPIQENALYEYGADKVRFYVGYLESLYRAIHPEVSDKIRVELGPYLYNISKAPASLSRLIFEEREREALDCCKELALRQPNPEVNIFLVYGLGHDMEQAIADYNDPAVQYAGAYDFTLKLDAEQSKLKLIKSPAQFFNTMPEELKRMIAEDGLDEHLKKEKISLPEMVGLYHEKPWVLKALCCYNFSKAFQQNLISLEQLKQLTQHQVTALKSGVAVHELQERVIMAIAENTPKFVL